MKKVLFGLTLMLGVAVATPAFAQAPRAAALGHHGHYSCPPGYTLVNYPSSRLVSWYETVTEYQTVTQNVCIAWGPWGRCRLYGQPIVTQVPVTHTVLRQQWVPANAQYCVWGTPAPVPFPGPHPHPHH